MFLQSPLFFLRPDDAVVLLVQLELFAYRALPADASQVFPDAPVFPDSGKTKTDFLSTLIPGRAFPADAEFLDLLPGSFDFFRAHVSVFLDGFIKYLTTPYFVILSPYFSYWSYLCITVCIVFHFHFHFHFLLIFLFFSTSLSTSLLSFDLRV